MLIAMFVDSILAIFGFFSSMSAIVFYFTFPLLFIMKYPKIKGENLARDNIDEADNFMIDPTVVAAVSLLSSNPRKSVERLRTFSNSMFGNKYNELKDEGDDKN